MSTKLQLHMLNAKTGLMLPQQDGIFCGKPGEEYVLAYSVTLGPNYRQVVLRCKVDSRELDMEQPLANDTPTHVNVIPGFPRWENGRIIGYQSFVFAKSISGSGSSSGSPQHVGCVTISLHPAEYRPRNDGEETAYTTTQSPEQALLNVQGEVKFFDRPGLVTAPGKVVLHQPSPGQGPKVLRVNSQPCETLTVRYDVLEHVELRNGVDPLAGATIEARNEVSPLFLRYSVRAEFLRTFQKVFPTLPFREASLQMAVRESHIWTTSAEDLDAYRLGAREFVQNLEKLLPPQPSPPQPSSPQPSPPQPSPSDPLYVPEGFIPTKATLKMLDEREKREREERDERKKREREEREELEKHAGDSQKKTRTDGNNKD